MYALATKLCHIAFVRNQQKNLPDRRTATRRAAILGSYENTDEIRGHNKLGSHNKQIGVPQTWVLINLYDVDCGVVFTICALPLALRPLLYSDDNTCPGVADCKRKWGARCSAKS